MNNVELAAILSKLNKTQAKLDKITKQAAQKYELIETITVSEENVSVISRTQEPDGTNYDFQKMKVYMTIPAQSELAATVISTALVNDVRALRVSTLYNTSESKTAFLRCKIDSGYLSCEQTTTTPATSSGFMLGVPIYTIFSSDIEADSINSFVFSNVDNTIIPIGSEFKIYAVRSDS